MSDIRRKTLVTSDVQISSLPHAYGWTSDVYFSEGFCTALFIAASIVLSGCAFVSQQVELTPKVTVAGTNLGLGIAAGVKVSDERTSTTIGRRNAGPPLGDGTAITLKDDLATAARQQVVGGLRGKCFVPTDFNATAPSKLTIEIREMSTRPRPVSGPAVCVLGAQ
jgi:hypothetical protein